MSLLLIGLCDAYILTAAPSKGDTVRFCGRVTGPYKCVSIRPLLLYVHYSIIIVFISSALISLCASDRVKK